MKGGAVRRRYFLAVSAGYIILGVIILARSIVGHVLPVGLLGLVLIALGLVRLRDYLSWRHETRGS